MQSSFAVLIRSIGSATLQRLDLTDNKSSPGSTVNSNRKSVRNRNRLSRPLLIEILELRALMCADGHGHAPSLGEAHLELGSFPALETFPLIVSGASVLSAPSLSGASYTTSAIPALNSLAGAAATLFLDFDGHYDAWWGGYSNVHTPAFDQDGDASTFSEQELASIREIWEHVAEDFAPFNINVTTVSPATFENGAAMRVAIGGEGAWSGGLYGGVAYVNTFTNSVTNTVYVFAKNLANGYAKYVADAASHEAGHGFGLEHQSAYGAGGVLLDEYSPGPGDDRAPIMGNSYAATRSQWWYGTSVAAGVYQDDLAKIARAANGFGFRSDDHGNAANVATLLAAAGTRLSGTGVITTSRDLDYFAFTTGAGQVTLSVNVASGVNNLDARLELRNAAGAVIASAAPADSFGASITVTVAAGSYRLVVASQGNYGDVGQYTIAGTIVPEAATPLQPTSRPASPRKLTARALGSNVVRLAWRDRSSNEQEFVVQRSENGGRKWKPIARLGANATEYNDYTAKARTRYVYRVQASNVLGNSGYSNKVKVSTPRAFIGAATSQISKYAGLIANGAGPNAEAHSSSTETRIAASFANSRVQADVPLMAQTGDEAMSFMGSDAVLSQIIDIEMQCTTQHAGTFLSGAPRSSGGSTAEVSNSNWERAIDAAIADRAFLGLI